jgi:hypothetical protein
MSQVVAVCVCVCLCVDVPVCSYCVPDVSHVLRVTRLVGLASAVLVFVGSPRVSSDLCSKFTTYFCVSSMYLCVFPQVSVSHVPCVCVCVCVFPGLT